MVPAIIILAMIYIFPTIDMQLNSKEQPDMWPGKKINLGLDLQGGMHLVLEVETQKAVEAHMERVSDELRSLLRKERIRHKGITLAGGKQISVTIKETDVDGFNVILIHVRDAVSIEIGAGCRFLVIRQAVAVCIGGVIIGSKRAAFRPCR